VWVVTREIVRFSAHNARVPSTDGGRVGRENGRRRVNAIRRPWRRRRVARARFRSPARRFARPRSHGGGTTLAADSPLIINFPAVHTPAVFIAAGYYRRTFKFSRPSCHHTGRTVLLNVAGRD